MLTTPGKKSSPEVYLWLFIFVWSILNSFVFKCRNHSCYKSKCNIVCFVCSVCSLLFCNLGFIQALLFGLFVCPGLFYMSHFYHDFIVAYFVLYPIFTLFGVKNAKNHLQIRISTIFLMSFLSHIFCDIIFTQNVGVKIGIVHSD